MIEAAPIVSVVVPIYNGERYLRDSLDSLLAQTFQDFEIICVNDGSTDSSESIINEYAERDSRQPNKWRRCLCSQRGNREC